MITSCLFVRLATCHLTCNAKLIILIYYFIFASRCY
nr:MAG TPA: hypothetical protein [Caudoviricetes sp.]